MELNFIEYYVFDDNDGQFHICVFFIRSVRLVYQMNN